MPADQHTDPFEDRLSAALHEVGGTFDAPRSELAAAGARRGRRLQLQRRAALAGSVASLALVGVGGALLVPWHGGPASRPSSVAGSGTPDRSRTYSADDVVRTLQQLLPQGTFTRTEARGTDEGLPPLAVGVFDDGKGEGSVSVGLERITTGERKLNPSAEVMPCPDSTQSGFDSCTTESLPDGSAITVYQGYEYPDRRVDTKSWGADLVTPDGHRVSVIEWNSPAEKDKPITRTDPPLTPAQLKALASAAEWRAIIDALPREKPPSRTTAGPTRPGELSGVSILRKLKLLLPKKVDVVSHGSDETGYGSFVVDDGKGRSLVQVNVQPGMSDVAGDLFGSDAETLADGTLVTVRRAPGEKGGAGVVMWTADTLRKNGLRVVISAFNTGDQNKAATRKAPALTLGDLRRIALSPEWLTDTVTP
ncbi:hypothetical protein [Streptomyces sp. DSM 15324]|uniref:hypothetical protein n=1 Tax=Streptomyces sp. DSM 15324 TaxID=1739111 RepID=UPI0007485A46|nr:hypothetical protein [Streptomyces sp. DSM 15324]KUO11843.1 hypothetical protein AQJ58_11820 [Streptomyces sp. DSM 15324]